MSRLGRFKDPLTEVQNDTARCSGCGHSTRTPEGEILLHVDIDEHGVLWGAFPVDETQVEMKWDDVAGNYPWTPDENTYNRRLTYAEAEIYGKSIRDCFEDEEGFRRNPPFGSE